MSQQTIVQLKRSIRNFLESSYYKIKSPSCSLDCNDYKSIVFLCYGNIIRSPFCEFYLKNKLTNVNISEIKSAGFFLKQGRSSPENAQYAAKRLNVDLSSHFSKTISEEMVKDSTLIIGMHYSHYALFQKHFPMDTHKFVLLKYLSYPKSALLNIADPYGQPPEAFSNCYLELQRCLDRLIEKIVPCSHAITEQQQKDVR